MVQMDIGTMQEEIRMIGFFIYITSPITATGVSALMKELTLAMLMPMLMEPVLKTVVFGTGMTTTIMNGYQTRQHTLHAVEIKCILFHFTFTLFN